jgi:hypothetical protein
MRQLQQLSMAVVLSAMLATGAFAGIIQTPVAPPAPAPPSATATGIIQTGIQTPSDQQNLSPSEAFAEATVNLLRSLLSVF